ncbi:TPA: restriction endonuclease subunit S [Staphylococcus aureus]|uniref:restriction endonuclease subunit S n=1 Tax=Staphylococcus aureus TaxID=1280 RepID=UPI0009112B75|nr:restriction endonuclease subunit S [Staphylococcus aureus]MDI1878575.1 restriction endonuclease subunit S [Staphylococcus aureus]QPV66846.1 restriction endonuclease subunit S [Staphylococcus aureus]SGR84871.1 type I restriction modification DNA specificity domain protein [Staphylococcus aureus]SGT92166.1 type I restriction modification DNA specificity domain protein [Staphylococcus aureus]SGU59159.1 type I restriction modification DNA specificity domain protein [Staphylococcus aureus]
MSNTQKKNVPELRFPGFEGEWEEKKLGDLTDRVIRKNKNLESKKPLTISGQLGLIDQTEYFSKSVSSKNLENYTLIKNGEFAYNKSYSNGYPLGAIKRLTRYDSGVLSSLYICFSIKSEMSKDFMEAYFDSTHWYREVSGIAVEGARNHGLLNVSVNDFFTILIKYPSLEEQQKIGKFFSKLDRQIELEEQKLELLKQQKKGYMQKIFSQELRFKDENGNDYPEWEKKKLKEIACVYTGNTPSKKENIYWNKGEYVWVTPTDINNSKNIYESEHKLTQEGYKKARQLPENTLLVTCIASIGKNAILRKQGSCNQQINAVVPFENINIDYLYYISDSLSTFMKSIAGKTATQIVNKNTFENLEIYLASFEEQKKIADLISSLEELIEKQASKLIKMKSRKQGMLQIMFI